MKSIEILGRRQLVFKYMSLGLTPVNIHALVKVKYPCSLKTIRRDVRSRGEWLPSLLSIEEGEADTALLNILGRLQLAQERLLQLTYDSDNSNAMVGAARALGVLADKEASIRMDTGQISREPLKLETGPHQFVYKAWRPNQDEDKDDVDVGDNG